MPPRARFRPRLTDLERRDQPAVGDLDTFFNGTGVATTTFNPGTGNSDSAAAVAVQPDGRVVAVGSAQFTTPLGPDFDFVAVRYRADGSLDDSFGTQGKVQIEFDQGGDNDDRATAVALQPDGRIVVAGQSITAAGILQFAVARLNPDGSLDTTFDFDGRKTFSFDAGRTSAAAAVTVQADGDIVVAGYADVPSSNSLDFAVARLTADGALDKTFSGDGLATFGFDLGVTGGNSDYASAVALQADGRIVLAGTASVTANPLVNQFAVARFATDGTPDVTFNTTGGTAFAVVDDALDSRATGVAMQQTGGIVVGGYSQVAAGDYDFAVARLTPAGKLDSTFAGGGKTTVAVDFVAGANDIANALTLQPDDKILLAGRGDQTGGAAVAVVRLTEAGVPDAGFGTDGISGIDLGQIDEAFGVAVGPDGTIYAVGETVDGANTDLLVGALVGDSPLYRPGVRIFTCSEGNLSTVTNEADEISTYAVNAGGLLYRIDSLGAQLFIAGGVNSVSAGSDALGRDLVYVLFNGGFLWQFSEFTGWKSLASDVAAVDAESVDTCYVLFNGGFLWRRDTTGWQSVAGNVLDFSAGTDGIGRQQVAVLFSGNFLWVRNEATGWSSLAGNVLDVSAGVGDNVYVLFTGNFLWRNDGSQWIDLGGNVFDVSAGEDAAGNSVGYVQFFGGFLWRNNAVSGWSSVASGVTTAVAAGENAVVVLFDGGFLYLNRPPQWTDLGGGF